MGFPSRDAEPGLLHRGDAVGAGASSLARCSTFTGPSFACTCSATTTLVVPSRNTDATAPTNSGNAWVWLGAVANATRRASLGSAVTGIVHRYNPVVVAQQVATLEFLAPGRAFLGVGSSEAMNEIPAGMDWPTPSEQLERTEEALTIITRLLDGETVDFDDSALERFDVLDLLTEPVYVLADRWLGSPAEPS